MNTSASLRRNLLRMGVLLVAVCLFGTASTQAQYNLLYEFGAGAGAPVNPFGQLIASGSTLYGMTVGGGATGNGTVFKINANGSGFTVLHDFGGVAGDGSTPYSSLTLSGSTLYGVTDQGGAQGYGTVFKVDTDGNNYSVLHDFVDTGAGANPYGSLMLDGSTLYGTTRGGFGNYGTVYKINTSGSGFSTLHEFAGGGSDGAIPYGALALSGSTLYGLTSGGGDNNVGTLFKIDADGGNFGLLHEFTGVSGSTPYGSLTLGGATLYGMTYYGGISAGTVFSIDTDGSDFSLLHSFTSDANDGGFPSGALTLDGSALYGFTRYGGDNDKGVLFTLQTNGSGYSLLHEFAGAPGDGNLPYNDAPLLLNGTLYGMTVSGGVNDTGTIWTYAVVPEPSGFALTTAGLLSLWTASRRRSRR